VPIRVFISSELPEELERELGDLKFLALPLIKTVPVSFNPLVLEAFNPEFLVFSSKNGVKHFFSRVSPEKVRDKKIVSVGKSTAEYLKTLGLESLYPSEFSAEGLVQLFQGEKLIGRRFLIVRPKIARRLLANFLKESGAVVEELVVYETVPDYSRSKEVLKFFEDGVDLVALTSPSNLKALLEIVPFNLLKGGRFIPIGTTTKRAIEEKGLSVIGLPEEFSLRGIVHFIRKVIN